jgi:phosphoribosylanthranilate isomerase
MTKIKICGIKNEEQAIAAAGAGADFIGLVFAPSPRQVTPARAARIVATLKESRKDIGAVGVFVNTPAATVNKVAATCHLDWVQLSGDESWEYCREINTPVIKVIRLSWKYQPEVVCADLTDQRQSLFLLDSKGRRKYGGTGRTFDWDLARPIASQFPVIIAGGLSPDNVMRAIKIIGPWGVDVSTGVESQGEKDMNKIKEFIAAVREADVQA